MGQENRIYALWRTMEEAAQSNSGSPASERYSGLLADDGQEVEALAGAIDRQAG